MSRRRVIVKRIILPDPKYGNVTLAKFINMVMSSGKKAVAESIVYGALDVIGERKGGDPLEVLESAISQVRPVVEVKSRRVGGATYQVPIEVRQDRQMTLGMRWLIDSARRRGEKGMARRLAGEILEASEGRGVAVKKREDTHRMAEANRAFAHFRW